MPRSPRKVGVLVRAEFVVYDSNRDPVTGLVNGDFTKLLSKNGVDDATAVTVTEIANGRYAATFTPATVGFWALLIRHATHNKRGWAEAFDVTTDGLPSLAETADAVHDEPMAGHTAAGSFGELVQTNYYQAKVEIIDDDAGTTDRYLVAFFKNTQPVVSGITSPTIQVVKASDGSDLIASIALTQIGSTGRYKKDATGAERIVDGAGYVAIITATIDGTPRTWSHPIGRDS